MVFGWVKETGLVAEVTFDLKCLERGSFLHIWTTRRLCCFLSLTPGTGFCHSSMSLRLWLYLCQQHTFTQGFYNFAQTARGLSVGVTYVPAYAPPVRHLL